MKRIVCICLFIEYICCASYDGKNERSIIQVDFLESQQISKDVAAKEPFINFVKPLYDKFILKDLLFSVEPRIPKIIHQIWLGSPVPAKYRSWQDSIKKNHPGWTFMLWDDEKLKNFPMHNKKLFEEARSYAIKSDIARYEILHQLGGVYLDCDIESFKPLDVFHYCCDFYAGLETNLIRVANSIIGSSIGNPVMAECINVISRANVRVSGFMDIVNVAGPKVLTDAFVKVMSSCDDRCVVFPSGFFYPKAYKYSNGSCGYKELRPESFCIHYWCMSWWGA